MVLRYFIPVEGSQKRFQHLVDFIERTSIKRIILFTGAFVEESTFFPLDYYKEHAEMLSKYMPVLHNMGVETGINVLNTMGHVFYANDGELTYRRACDIYGDPSNGSVCLRDNDFHQYVRTQYTYYAQLKPSVIFLDDDIRHIKMNNIVCLCDEHVNEVSCRIGEMVNREQIKEAILSDDFDVNPIKKFLMDILKEDVDNITSIIEKTVHSLSPDTSIGIMTGSFPDVTFDRDLKKHFATYATDKINRVRTGMNFYREGEHKEIPRAFANPMIQRNLIDNPNVEIQPEVENDIYTKFYKSKAVTHLQLVWCLTNGMRNMQLNLFDLLDNQICDFDYYVDMLAENMDYYNSITQFIPEGNKTSGVGIYKNSRSLLYRRIKSKKNMDEFLFQNDWYQWLGLDGLPIGYDWEKTPWQLLSGDDILGADSETIENILKRGAIIDLRAAECLFHMGYGERIGVESIEDLGQEFAGERFLEHAMNGQFSNVHNSYYFHSGLINKNDVKRIQYIQGAVEISKIINHHKEKVANGLTMYENKNGERFCVIPVDTGLFQQFANVNYKRKEQLINIFEWIARKPLPVVSLHANVVVNINQFKDKDVISLFNLTTDEVKCIKLKCDNYNLLFCVKEDGSMEETSLSYVNNELTVDSTIKPMGCKVFVHFKTGGRNQ